MNESAIQCHDVEYIKGNKGQLERVEHRATWCMICQSIVHDVYILDHGVHHCLLCMDESEINSITTVKCKREGRTIDNGLLQREYASFRKIALLDDNIHNVNVTQHNAIKCVHGKWNKDRTTWKWEEKWFCNLCPKSFKDVVIDPSKKLTEHQKKKQSDLNKMKKDHENYHKEQQTKKQSRDKSDPIEKVVWVLREDRRLSEDKYVL